MANQRPQLEWTAGIRRRDDGLGFEIVVHCEGVEIIPIRVKCCSVVAERLRVVFRRRRVHATQNKSIICGDLERAIGELFEESSFRGKRRKRPVWWWPRAGWKAGSRHCNGVDVRSLN